MADGSPNPYIRTFAKDMASVSSQPGPTPHQATSPSLPSDGGGDREAVLKRLRARANKNLLAPEEPAAATPAPLPPPPVLPTPPSPAPTPTQEVKKEEAPVIREESLPAPFVPPVPAAPPVVPTPAPVPAPVPPVSIPSVSEPKIMPVPPAPEAPPPPPSAPVPSAPISEPVFSAIPVLIPKTREVPPQPVAAPPAASTPVAVPKPSPLHTYSSDFADRIDRKDASAFSVLASEADSGRAAPRALSVSWKPSRGLVITVASILLVACGGGGLYAAYLYVAAHKSVPLMPTVASLVFADERQSVTGEGGELLSAIAASADTPLADGKVRVLYLTESSTTPTGVTVTTPLSGGQLVGSLQLSAPDILLRNVAPESTVGIVHAGAETRGFFILRVLSYERTFAGMLQWEETMQASLAALYPLYAPPPPPSPTIATTTKVVNGKKVIATTTVEAAPLPVSAPRFIDEVASNHDVRALKDAEDRTILLYGYTDKETLIIARNEAAFAELVNRLAATKQQ